MPNLPSRTSVKLIGGFLAILLLFFWAAFLTLRSLEKVEKSAERLAQIAEGVRAGRMMTEVVRDQYIQLAQFVITRDWTYVDQFENLSRRMAPLKKQVAEQDIWSEDEKRVIRMLQDAHQKFEDVFESDLRDAVAENDIDRVRRVQKESESLLQQAISLNINLEQLFQRKIKMAQKKQAELSAGAKRSPFIFFGAAVLASLLIVVYLGRSIAEPVQELIRGTQEIARGNLAARIKLERKDEFGRLAESFNRMTRELHEHQRRMIQSEKMASLGQLAAGVAHEINNPIGVIRGYIKILQAGMKSSGEYGEELKAIEEEAAHCQRIVSELRNFSKPTNLAIERVDAREVVDEALDRLDRVERAKGALICVRREYGAEPQFIAADRGKVREVLLNVVENAVDAMPKGGEIRVGIRRVSDYEHRDGQETARGDFVLVEIADTGCGICEENMKRLFDPFFSTKERGMGLGLAISYAIVKAHSGFMEARSAEGKGSVFSIGIPAAK